MPATQTKELTDIEFTTPGVAPAAVPAVVEAAPPPAVAQPADATILGIIERAARDPNVDIDKMERLFRMKLDMEARAAKAAYLSELAEMQPKLPVITKHGVINKNEKDARGNNTGRQEAMTKYARWEDVVEGITPILTAHGFSLTFRIAQPTPDRIVVTGVLGHRAGHTEETAISLPIDNTGAKNNVQGWGSSTSYGKRYTGFALLNIVARGEDDDGNGANGDWVDEAERDGLLKNGERRSTYDVDVANRAKDWADSAIQRINHGNPEQAREWRREAQTVPKGKRKSPLDWLEDNAPGQYVRVRQCYQNVAGEDFE